VIRKGQRCGDEILEQKHSLCGDLTVWNGIELYAVTAGDRWGLFLLLGGTPRNPDLEPRLALGDC
jgi:hypothetical protein